MSESQAWKPKHNPWLIALTVTMATFMEVLDSSIANVATNHIAGSLGNSQDEATWVLTSYLVASAIILPISGWLANVIGRKRFYMICVAIFTASSLLCGLSTSLPMLIIFRVVQGLGGGGLGTSEQSILADTFDESKRGLAFSVYGMAVVVAPALGPTLGGYITDNYSWHWIFFINIPIGILSLVLTHRLVEDPPQQIAQRRKKFNMDFVGISAIVLGIGCLQVMLDKGQQEDWFASPMIIGFCAAAVAGIAVMIVWEWFTPDPVMDLRLMKNKNLAMAVLLNFILGAVLNGTTILMPQFLQGVLGYTAERSGLALSPGGIALMILMPVAGLLVSRFDLRVLVAVGFLLTSWGLWQGTHLYAGISFGDAIYYRVVQMIGLPLIFIPISTLAYVGIAPDKTNQVSGLTNFSRNLGGAFGTSLLSAFITRTGQTHHAALATHIQSGNTNYQTLLSQYTQSFLSQGFDQVRAQSKALARIAQTIETQSSVLSYVNMYWLLAIGVACVVPLAFLMKKPNPEEAQRSGH